MCHSHLAVDFRKIRSKKKKNTFKAIILIKFQIRNIDKVVKWRGLHLKSLIFVYTRVSNWSPIIGLFQRRWPWE